MNEPKWSIEPPTTPGYYRFYSGWDDPAPCSVYIHTKYEELVVQFLFADIQDSIHQIQKDAPTPPYWMPMETPKAPE